MNELNPQILECFFDKNLYSILNENLGVEGFNSYLKNSSKFQNLVETERNKNNLEGLFGEEITIPKSKHKNGKIRVSETGNKLNIGYLPKVGINPKEVLFYRITEPSKEPKPEYYWTSDYMETISGLNVEIPFKQKEKSVILISDLYTINQNEGLIQDPNDCGGISVRQIGIGSFNQDIVKMKLNYSSLGNQ